MHDSINISQLDEERLNEAQTLLKDRFDRVIERYLSDIERYATIIREGVGSGDYEAVHHAAHSLKGASNSLGLVGVGKVALAIEEVARDGGHIQALVAMLPHLEEALQFAERKLRPMMGGA